MFTQVWNLGEPLGEPFLSFFFPEQCLYLCTQHCLEQNFLVDSLLVILRHNFTQIDDMDLKLLPQTNPNLQPRHNY